LSSKYQKIREENKMYAEPVIAMYNINSVGHMQRRDNVPVTMLRRYHPSDGANMTFSRSRDKTIISLTHFERYSAKSDHFKILAWTIALNPWPVCEDLNVGLNQFYVTYCNSIEKIEELQFVGRCNYLLLTYIESATQTRTT
jgi:hypothetical protein